MTQTVYVVSTDIKKSSLLWAFNGGMWMKNHIVLHHALIQVWADDYGFFILPNSPEGDAFILYTIVAHNNREARLVILTAVENLQRRFEAYRTNGALVVHSSEKNYEPLTGNFGKRSEGDNLPGIRIRVGVASGKMTEENWKPYDYARSSFSTGCYTNIKSYRGRIVTASENMETKSDVDGYEYEDIDVVVPDDPKEKTAAKYRGKKARDLHIVPMKGWELKFLHRTDKRFRELQTTMIELKKFAVVAFIHGELETEIQKTERLERLKAEENDTQQARRLDQETNDPKLSDFIKVKRDGTQMMVIYPDPTAKHTKIGTSAIERALRMLKPQTTCHIGLSFGEVNISSIRLIYNGKNDTGQGGAVVCSTKDLFGDVVNLAARAAGAGIRVDQKTSTDHGNYYSYLGMNENENRNSNFVILIPAAGSKKEPTMGGVLTKTGLANAVKHGGGKRVHDHSDCTFDKKTKEDKNDSFHTIQRSDINAGKKGTLLQWWWTSTK